MTSAAKGTHVKRILLVDDESSQLTLYATLLSHRLSTRIVTSRFPTEALRLAKEHLFDVIVVDVTMQYNGSPFGGLELYKQLVARYGSESVIAYSKFITEDLLARYDYTFNFVETGDDPVQFAAVLAKRVVELRNRQRCFVAMPFGGVYEGIWKTVKRSIKAAAFEPLRVDKESFNTSIVQQILQGISDAKLVIFVAMSRNPNVFYEAGFAHALGKEIITLTDTYSTLPFDVRDRNAIAFGDDLTRLESLLRAKLRRVT